MQNNFTFTELRYVPINQKQNHYKKEYYYCHKYFKCSHLQCLSVGENIYEIQFKKHVEGAVGLKKAYFVGMSLLWPTDTPYNSSTFLHTSMRQQKSNLHFNCWRTTLILISRLAYLLFRILCFCLREDTELDVSAVTFHKHRGIKKKFFLV